MITIRNALTDATEHLKPTSTTARLDAEWLLASILSCETTYFAMYPEKPLTMPQIEQYANWLQRRAQGEPVAYILGEVGFYDLMLAVSPAVLIPRPETELLVEEALAWARMQAHRKPFIGADIGTGSGAIAVTLAHHLPPDAQIHAVDISPEALVIARHNAEKYQTTLTFHQGNLAQPLIEAGLRVDLLVANLPYIAHDEVANLAVSDYEPALALDGGHDGLAMIRDLFIQLPEVCANGALVLLEIGATQGDDLLALITTSGGQGAHIIADYAGLNRIARFTYP